MTEIAVPLYIRQLRSVFEAIAQRIEELLILLNEVGDDEPHTLQVADRVNQFLEKLKESIGKEKILAKKVSTEKRQRFLQLMREEVLAIRQLQAYVLLSKRRPTPQVILKIAQLDKTLEGELALQEHEAA